MGTVANVLVGDAAITITGVGNVGYTVDGATLTISSEFADIKVEETIGTIIRKLTGQEVKVAFTMAEGTLVNLEQAIPGSTLAAPILTIGGGALKDIELILTGTKPGGGNRVITLPHCNPAGEVGIPFKKGEISVVPVIFSALASNLGVFGTINDT